MYQEFTKNLCDKLIQEDFHILYNRNAILTEDTKYLYLGKNISPVYYMIGIVNCQEISPSDYEEIVKNDVLQIEKTLQQIACTRVINLNILVTNPQDMEVSQFLQSTSFLPDSTVFHVWWKVFPEQMTFTAGPGQPDKLLNIHTMLAKAAQSKNEYNTDHLLELETHIRKKSSLTTLGGGKLTFGFILLNTFIWLATLLLNADQAVVSQFANSGKMVFEYREYYRLVTSLFLHGGIEHLLFNSLSLYIFGLRTERYFGEKFFLLIYFGAGIAGNLVSAIGSYTYSIGASGAIYGLIAAVYILSRKTGKAINGLHHMTILIMILFGLCLGLADTGVDNFAHFGGFFTGFVLSVLILKFSRILNR